MTTIRFTVPGVPVAQPRQRTTVRQFGDKVVAQNYTPTKHPVNAFKAAVQNVAKVAYSGPPLAGPLRMDVLFLMPRPKSMIWAKRPMPREWHVKKPDRDNLEKSLLDALKGQLFVDDCQIVAGPIRKMYAAGDEQPGVIVEVNTL